MGRIVELASVLFLCGCPGVVDKTLADIKSFSSFEVYLPKPASDDLLYLTLGYYPREPDDCPRLGPEAKAFLDSTPLDVVSRGDIHNDPPDGSSCVHPAFKLDAGSWRSLVSPPHEQAAISLVDRSATWSMTIERPLDGSRGFQFSSPSGSTLVAGQDAILEWSPDTDKVAHPAFTYLYEDGKRGFEIVELRGEVEQVGDRRFRFAVPMIPSGRGTFMWSILAHAKLADCTGASQCSAEAPGSGSMPASIAQ
jgi:hypothetical protein